MRFKLSTYLVCIILYCIQSFTWAANIKDIRIGVKTNYTRIVFDLDKAPKIYNVKYMTSPDRIVLDFTEGKISRHAIKNTSAYALIKNINGTNIRNNGLSIEIELEHTANFKHFILPPSNNAGYRLVIDITQGKHKFSAKSQTIIPNIPSPKINVTNYKSDAVNIYKNNILTDATMDRLFQPFLGNTQLNESSSINSVIKNKSATHQEGNNRIKSRENDNSPTFTIRGYKIKGNTLLSLDILKASIQPFTGDKRNFSDVQHALEALELSYQKAGFGMVQVYLPEQELEKGIIEFNVIEPKIKTLTVQGAEHFNLKNIETSIVSLREGETPNTNLISKNLTLINENPAKKTTIEFLSTDKEGEINTLINVKDKKPTNYTLLVDNTGTESTGYYRIGFAYQHANLTDNDDVFNFQYTRSEKNRALNAFSFGYHLPLYTLNSSLDVFAGHSDIDSGVIQDFVNISGQGLVFGTRFNQFLSKQGSYTHRLSYGYDFRQYDTDAVYLVGSGPTYPSITVQPISIVYSGQWTSSGSATGFNLQFYSNVFAGESDTAVFNESRTGAKPNYTIFRFGIEHAQAIAKTWQFRIALTGQETANALISGEQFGIGGANSVRGYNERDVSNDKGLQVTTEIYSPNFASSIGMGGDIRGLVFYDYGQASRNLPQPSDPDLPPSLSSFGIGIRLSYKESITFKLDVASPLNESITQEKGETKVHAAVKYTF